MTITIGLQFHSSNVGYCRLLAVSIVQRNNSLSARAVKHLSLRNIPHAMDAERLRTIVIVVMKLYGI